MVTPSDVQDATTTASERRVMVHHNVLFNIPGDKVKLACQDLPPEQAHVIWWFYQWCRKHDFSRASLGTVLKKIGGGFYSPDSIVQLLTGGRARRGENIEPLLDAIETLRKIEEERSGQAHSGFIPTRLAKEIFKRCKKALLRQRLMFIFGDSQIGKTAALQQFQKDTSAGQVVYVETPTGGGVGAFIFQLAKQFSIPTKMGCRASLRERVIESFDSRMLLIVDEAHRCLHPRNTSGLEVYSFLRELWNRRQCGIVLAFTNEGRDAFLHGPHASILAQLWRRRITPLQLPNVPPDDDAALFAAAYGLPEATEDPVTVRVTLTDEHGKSQTKQHTDSPLRLQREVLKMEGLGVWIGILQDASDMASEQERKISWAAVIKAYSQSLAEAQVLD
ncbi:MAG: AAA family ATPase [Verrucomicrobiota bacterium]